MGSLQEKKAKRCLAMSLGLQWPGKALLLSLEIRRSKDESSVPCKGCSQHVGKEAHMTTSSALQMEIIKIKLKKAFSGIREGHRADNHPHAATQPKEHLELTPKPFSCCPISTGPKCFCDEDEGFLVGDSGGSNAISSDRFPSQNELEKSHWHLEFK